MITKVKQKYITVYEKQIYKVWQGYLWSQHLMRYAHNDAKYHLMVLCIKVRALHYGMIQAFMGLFTISSVFSEMKLMFYLIMITRKTLSVQ